MFSKEELSSFREDFNASHQNLEGEKLENLSRKEFFAWLADKKEELKGQISSSVTLSAKGQKERIERAKNDFLYFAKTYFPHYFTLKGESGLHKHLISVFETINEGKGSNKFAIAAPRGNGKTIYAGQLFPLWCICFNKKRFIVEVSDAVELVEGILEAIKTELEENANLAFDFPQACGASNSWKVGEFVTRNGVKLKAFGSGKRLRGVKFGVYRPDLVILDDLENDTNVRSLEQRDKLEEWLDSAVINLGDASAKIDILYIGTILHYDSLLARKLSLAFWNPKKFKSIMEFPQRMDLWDIFAHKYKTLGVKSAENFYHKNKQAMDKGAKLLWEEAISLVSLMEARASNPKAFSKEQQNEPSTEAQKFRRENLHFYKNLPNKFEAISLFCDPAGAKKKSDYTAFVVLGLSEGKFYCLEAIGGVFKSRVLIEKFLELYIKYKPNKAGIETNFGGDFLKDSIKLEASRRGVPLFLKGINNTENKEVRIERLEIPIEEGDILIHESQSLLIEQLVEFPFGKNDDLPDCLEGALRLTKAPKAKRLNPNNYFKTRRLHKARREYGLVF